MCNPIRLAVLVSGSGTNLQALIDATERGELDGRIVRVVSDRPGAYALARAEKHGIPVRVLVRKDYRSREEYEEALAEELRTSEADLVLLAGFMRILSGTFLRHFPQRVMNIHPSLLPAFSGLDAQGQAWAYGVRVTGCTVHFVDEGMDSGPIILQAAVPVLDGDTRDGLAERILEQEHRIYPEAVRLYQTGRLRVEGRKVLILSKEADGQ